MPGLHLIDTTLAHNRQVITLKVEAPTGKKGNELHSCGFAKLCHQNKIWQSSKTIAVNYGRDSTLTKPLSARCFLLSFFFSFSFVLCLYACTVSSIYCLTSSLESNWRCIHGYAHHITSPQHYLSLKHRWITFNVKFSHYYFEVVKLIKLIIHNTTTIAKLTLFQMPDQGFLKTPPECSPVSKNLQGSRTAAHFVGT